MTKPSNYGARLIREQSINPHRIRDIKAFLKSRLQKQPTSAFALAFAKVCN